MSYIVDTEGSYSLETDQVIVKIRVKDSNGEKRGCYLVISPENLPELLEGDKYQKIEFFTRTSDIRPPPTPIPGPGRSVGNVSLWDVLFGKN